MATKTITAQLRDAAKAEGRRGDTHFECLKTVSTLLNRYQDIEDTLEENIPVKAKLKKIKKFNDEIGRVCAKYLPV